MEKKMYVAPELDVLEVLVEQGFQASNDPVGDPDIPAGGTPW